MGNIENLLLHWSLIVETFHLQSCPRNVTDRGVSRSETCLKVLTPFVLSWSLRKYVCFGFTHKHPSAVDSKKKTKQKKTPDAIKLHETVSLSWWKWKPVLNPVWQCWWCFNVFWETQTECILNMMCIWLHIYNEQYCVHCIMC